MRLLTWLPPFLYMAVVFLLSSRPGVDVPEWFPGQDKLMHLVLYIPLGFLSAQAFAGSGFESARKIVLCGASLALLYGVADEIHQSFVPEREASVLDITADGLGALVGSYAYARLRWRRTATDQLTG